MAGPFPTVAPLPTTGPLLLIRNYQVVLALEVLTATSGHEPEGICRRKETVHPPPARQLAVSAPGTLQ